jgi:hypothetical protein
MSPWGKAWLERVAFTPDGGFIRNHPFITWEEYSWTCKLAIQSWFQGAGDIALGGFDG